jgi:hypothetical protein
MCTETVQVSPCNCSIILRHTCASHIAHTHKQINTAPCPKFHRNVIPGPRCRPGTCPARKDKFFTFETVGESLFEHSKRVDREWREERFRRKSERLRREGNIKEESGGQQRLKRVKRQDSKEMEISVKMEEIEDFPVKAEHEDVTVLRDYEDEDGMLE